MSVFGLTFLNPFLLLGLLALPVIWWLLRLTPPRPRSEVFPPTAVLAELKQHDETPAKSPWWLTALRLLMAALLILALANPVKNALDRMMQGDGPLLVILDDGWTAGVNWDERIQTATRLVEEARDASRPVALAAASSGSAANFLAGGAFR